MPQSVRLIHSEETDGGLDLADLVCPLDGSPATLQIWEKKDDESGVAIWVLVKSSPLANLPGLELRPELGRSSIVCYAEDAHMIFMNVHGFFYMVDLKTMDVLSQKKKTMDVRFICREGDDHCTYHAFTSFYYEDEGNYLFTFTLQHSKVDYFPYMVAAITLVVVKSMPFNLKLGSI